MKLVTLILVGIVPLSACSTVTDSIQPVPAAATSSTAPGSEPVDAARIEQDGPSPVPRDGWVETVSGWYRSKEACLEDRRRGVAGTPLSVAEECLEPNR